MDSLLPVQCLFVLALTLAAMITDLRARRIPNWLTVSGSGHRAGVSSWHRRMARIAAITGRVSSWIRRVAGPLVDWWRRRRRRQTDGRPGCLDRRTGSCHGFPVECPDGTGVPDRDGWLVACLANHRNGDGARWTGRCGEETAAIPDDDSLRGTGRTGGMDCYAGPPPGGNRKLIGPTVAVRKLANHREKHDGTC